MRGKRSAPAEVKVYQYRLGGRYCSVVGCSNNVYRDKPRGIAFFSFPKVPNQRALWISRLNRVDWSPNKYSRVCSDHFPDGKWNAHPLHPSYAPSLFPSENRGRSKKSRKQLASPAEVQRIPIRRRGRKDKESTDTASETEELNQKGLVETFKTVAVQTDSSASEIPVSGFQWVCESKGLNDKSTMAVVPAVREAGCGTDDHRVIGKITQFSSLSETSCRRIKVESRQSWYT